MSYPVAAGIRDMSASTMRYVPTIYSLKLLKKFYDATVLAQLMNTDYEGEIRQQGDQVVIRTTPDITIRDHRKGQTLVHEQPESAPITMDIDKGKYFAFSTNKVDDKQTDIKSYPEKWMDDASQQMKIAIDTDVLSVIYAQVHASNQGNTAGVRSASIQLGVAGTPKAVTKTNILEVIVDCGTVLDEESVSETGRIMVIPPIYAGLIKKSDLKDASLAGDGTSIMRNGRLGMIDRFMLYSSNLLATTADASGETCWNVIFGTKDGASFASQMTENESLPNPFAFGDLYRGLQVYGYKVVQTKALGWLYGYLG